MGEFVAFSQTYKFPLTFQFLDLKFTMISDIVLPARRIDH